MILPLVTTISMLRSAVRSSKGFFLVTIKSAHFPVSIVPVKRPIPAISLLSSISICFLLFFIQFRKSISLFHLSFDRDFQPIHHKAPYIDLENLNRYPLNILFHWSILLILYNKNSYEYLQ